MKEKEKTKKRQKQNKKKGKKFKKQKKRDFELRISQNFSSLLSGIIKRISSTF